MPAEAALGSLMVCTAASLISSVEENSILTLTLKNLCCLYFLYFANLIWVYFSTFLLDRVMGP